MVIVEMKRRNPRYGHPKIAEQISKLFGIEIDKDIVRWVLVKYYHPDTDGSSSSYKPQLSAKKTGKILVCIVKWKNS
ncbi:MAG: hypothetical protein GY792_26450 [Gammaproteobacteria bacterium]|nr:hypothetical protein [Gammaproteobacteria bacterium]